MAKTLSGGLTQDNVLILNAIRNNASMDYRSRIPAATQGNIQDVAANLHKFRPQWNEFMGALINRIGDVVVRDISWTNPLAEFKRGMLEFGDTIEEIQIGLIEAKVYDPDRQVTEEVLFGNHRPRVESNFHTVNRQNRYDITVNEALLKRAFLESGGLSSFVSGLLQSPATSDAVDEFLVTTALFATYERNGGFYHVNVPDVKSLDSDGADARLALRKIRAMAERLQFVSTAYNTAHMPTFAKADELVLFATPEYQAAVDVEALAGAFNLDKMQNSQRVVTIPEENFNIPGCQAIMTTKDFFVIADQVFETRSMENPASLSTNHFLHHWQVVSASRFVPAVMFHTGADDEVIRVNKKPTAISAVTLVDAQEVAVAPAGNVERGLQYQATATVTTDAPGGSQAIVWSLDKHKSNRTHISETGVVTVGQDETSGDLDIIATTAGFNEENLRDDAKTSKISVKVTGDVIPGNPNGKVRQIVVGAGSDGEVVIDVTDGTNAYTLPSTWTKWTAAEVKTVKVVTDGPMSVTKSFADKVLTVSADPAYGAPARDITVTLTAAS